MSFRDQITPTPDNSHLDYYMIKAGDLLLKMEIVPNPPEHVLVIVPHNALLAFWPNPWNKCTNLQPTMLKPMPLLNKNWHRNLNLKENCSIKLKSTPMKLLKRKNWQEKLLLFYKNTPARLKLLETKWSELKAKLNKLLWKL